ncbi:MAG TPA: hypothetical protein VMH80_18310 [Bryobacteraceae bacterium]|nr:hypothetical protein [Bryobacteraceae bacterium]
MSRTDFEPEEQEFRRDIEAALSGQAGLGLCPKPDLLMAARSGVSFEGAESVLRRVALCPICEQLSRDLAEHEFPPASDAEDRRIRGKWQGSEGPLRSWTRMARPLALIAVAAVLVAGFFVVRDWRRPTPPRPTETAPQTTFVLTKASIKVPASAVLTYRGNVEAAKTYLEALAAALEPYRQDDYAEAARGLAELSRKYPNAAEPAYYLGVSQLFLNQNEAAVESLQAARSHADDAMRDDVSWYLAVAFDRVGRTSDARREAEMLCRQAGEYKDRACAALK